MSQVFIKYLCTMPGTPQNIKWHKLSTNVNKAHQKNVAKHLGAKHVSYFDGLLYTACLSVVQTNQTIMPWQQSESRMMVCIQHRKTWQTCTDPAAPQFAL